LITKQARKIEGLELKKTSHFHGWKESILLKTPLKSTAIHRLNVVPMSFFTGLEKRPKIHMKQQQKKKL
jgi:hypothetical protein